MHCVEDHLKPSLLYLPEEVIHHICQFLSTYDLFHRLACTCTYLYSLVRDASSYGKIANFLTLSNDLFVNHPSKETPLQLMANIIQYCAPFRGLDLEGICDHKLVNEIVQQSCVESNITSLKFRRYVCTSIDRNLMNGIFITHTYTISIIFVFFHF